MQSKAFIAFLLGGEGSDMKMEIGSPRRLS